MNKQTISKTLISLLTLLLIMSCIKVKDYRTGEEPGENSPYSAYTYPFKDEVQNVTAEIIIRSNKTIDPSKMIAEIPYLKYNKSCLVMLTQDDCKHMAYSCTWAAINGKPLSNQYFYDAAQLADGDLPPDTYNLDKTLGSTDGAGNEVRFHFTTTLSPEWNWMDAETEVHKGLTSNYFRFFMKSGLVWDNVKEIVNYGNGISLHDVNTEDANNPGNISQHYAISQDIILEKLSGRGCKMLAEPNGNKNYISAAQTYNPIQTMTAQEGAIPLQPFQVTNDLKKAVLSRAFYQPEDLKKEIEKQASIDKEKRTAVYVGVHGTDASWANILLWLNNTYGKDGDDSVWFPSQEEYYEYNYYRTHGSSHIEKIDENTLKLIVNLPSEPYFYYPSVTVNMKGISLEQVTSITSNEAVTGLSYQKHENGIMLNIDCRKYLLAHATHFVERYEKDKSNHSNKADALYFINMLKDSPNKTELLKRIK